MAAIAAAASAASSHAAAAAAPVREVSHASRSCASPAHGRRAGAAASASPFPLPPSFPSLSVVGLYCCPAGSHSGSSMKVPCAARGMPRSTSLLDEKKAGGRHMAHGGTRLGPPAAQPLSSRLSSHGLETFRVRRASVMGKGPAAVSAGKGPLLRNLPTPAGPRLASGLRSCGCSNSGGLGGGVPVPVPADAPLSAAAATVHPLSVAPGGAAAATRARRSWQRCACSSGDLRAARRTEGRAVGGLPDACPLICLPGGGMFCYWQIGALVALARRYDLSRVRFEGASAGALAGVLAASGVDGHLAAEKAFRISLDNGLWDRPAGLAGVWGRLVREWLHALLPPNAFEMCSSRLAVQVLELPSLSRRSLSFRHRLVSEYASNGDLIDCCMASVHIPFFMDGRPWARFGGRRCVDGSILAPSPLDVYGLHPHSHVASSSTTSQRPVAEGELAAPASCDPHSSPTPQMPTQAPLLLSSSLQGDVPHVPAPASPTSMLLAESPAPPSSLPLVTTGAPILVLDYTFDESMKSRRWQFLSLTTEQEGGGADSTWRWIEEMMACGGMFVEAKIRQSLNTGAPVDPFFSALVRKDGCEQSH